MSEPVQPVQPAGSGQPEQRASPLPPAAASGRSEQHAAGAGASEESVRRKLLVGAALSLALASIYAGVFNVGRVAQIVLAAAATMAMVLALTSRSRRRDS